MEYGYKEPVYTIGIVSKFLKVIVDKYLQLNDNCFVAGDAACFSFRGQNLRTAVQFALQQDSHAAANILRDIQGRKLKTYQPLDLGYIIPMGNGVSCGIALGVALKGFLPTLLHYSLCVLRSVSWKNRFGIIFDLLT